MFLFTNNFKKREQLSAHPLTTADPAYYRVAFASKPFHKRNILLQVLLGAALLFSLPGFGQTPTEGEWTFIQEIENVKFYYQTGNCNNHNFLLLKVVNENTAQIHGTWHLQIQDGTNKQHFIGVFMDMKAGATKSGACSTPDPHLVIPYKLTSTTAQLSVETRISRQ